LKTTEVIAENRVACKSTADANCKIALLTGPFDARKEGHSNIISLGIIGLSHLVEKAEEWIQACNSGIESKPRKLLDEERLREKHKLLFPDFPGAPAVFEKSLIIEPRFVQKLMLSEMTLLDKNNKYAYINGLLSLVESKLDTILEAGDRKPDVVLVLLTDEMYEICHIVGDYHKKLRKPKISDELQLNLFRDFDLLSSFDSQTAQPQEYRILRSALKKLAMSSKRQVPIQIIRERTLAGEETQNLATRSWNLCTGLYYKTGNLPWVIDNLDPKTCFLGVSFFHKKSMYQDTVYSSMAHLFSNDFDSIVLRGEQVAFDETLRSPVLDREKARRLVADAIRKYEIHRKSLPSRVVIHKTSRYRSDEIEGFREVLDGARMAYDLVSITKAPFRLVRWGQYPVPRGSFVEVNGQQAFLYTKGFVPDLQTYPGSHIPNPFQVDKSYGDSSIRSLCSEILALTKLNWNTADYCCGLPITIGFARSVGEVLKDFEQDDTEEPSNLYRFYM
jgi:hypothetical protein